MAKANKQANNTKGPAGGKSRVRVSIASMLMVLAGADLILLLAPEWGILNSLFYIPGLYTWPSLVLGIALLAFGFRHLYRRP